MSDHCKRCGELTIGGDSHCESCEAYLDLVKRLKQAEQRAERYKDALENAYDMLDEICDTPTDRQALKEDKG